ncbi:MAG: hypothetical protein KA319_09080 [Ferruginibacter sp.]|nr:hypothetical protein [Ferruginibacter sp.]
MKKVFLALAVVTVALVACNNEGEKKQEEVKKDSPVVENPVAPTQDTVKKDTVAAPATTTPAKDTVKK